MKLSAKKRWPWRPQIKLTASKLTLLALFLSLGFLLVILLLLLDAGAEPQGRQATSPVAVSAQGYQGLRDLIEARGGLTRLNRQEIGAKGADQRPKGDVMVVTLPTHVSEYGYRIEFRRPNSQISNGSAPIPQSVEDIARYNRFFEVPSETWSRAIFEAPLATKSVLIVLPKWNAETSRQRPRFAVNPTLIEAETFENVAASLSPVAKYALRDNDPRLISALYYSSAHVYDYSTGTKGYVTDENELIVFDIAPYDFRRAQKLKKVKRRERAIQSEIEFLPEDGTPERENYLNEEVDSFEPVALKVKLIMGAGHPPLDVGVINGLQTLSGVNLVPVVWASNGQPVLSRLIVTKGRAQPKVPVYVLSDPDLLNNQILSDPKKIVAAMRILETVAGKPVSKTQFVFDGTFNGMSLSLNLFHRLSEAPYLGIMLSILILGLGLIWNAFVRFGVPVTFTQRAALGQGVRVLADNTARLLAVALKDSQLAPHYARHIRDTVLKSYRANYIRLSQLNADEAAQRLSAAYRTSHSFQDLNTRAAKSASALEILKLCKDLHQWKTECQSGHRK